MEYRYHPPLVSLEGYVRTILSTENICPGDLPVLPQGTASLVCMIEQETAGRESEVTFLLFTQSIKIEALQPYPYYSLIAYFFHPFIAGPLFGIPATALTDHATDLQEWNAKKSGELLKKLKNSRTSNARIAQLDAFLQLQILKNQRICEVIGLTTDRIISDPVTEILPAILDELEISERTLQRVFKKYVGLSPGHFRRLCQFHSAFQQLRSREFGSLADIAYDQGYSDQSHFIRSFKEFTHKNPRGYLKGGLKNSAK